MICNDMSLNLELEKVPLMHGVLSGSRDKVALHNLLEKAKAERNRKDPAFAALFGSSEDTLQHKGVSANNDVLTNVRSQAIELAEALSSMLSELAASGTVSPGTQARGRIAVESFNAEHRGKLDRRHFYDESVCLPPATSEKRNQASLAKVCEPTVSLDLPDFDDVFSDGDLLQ